MTCSTCAAKQKAADAAARAEGRCVFCTELARPGARTCAYHHAKRAARRRKLKALVVAAYGGACACCREGELDFLTIDHINEDGAEHRRALFGDRRAGGVHFYRWLKREKFPAGFQVLCFNCNWSKHVNGGRCAHDLRRGSVTMATEKAKVILADCPWRYDNWTDKKNGAAKAHYETMELADICKLPVAEMSDKRGSVLGLWATWPKLDHAFAVLAAWGFTYVTGWPWIKITRGALEALPQSKAIVKTGVGFWAQGTSELFLIGRRGSRLTRKKAPPVNALWINRDGAEDSDLVEDRILYHAIGEHSVKPVGVHGYLSERFDGPYVELFAAREHAGWACYGRGTGYELTPGGVVKLPATAAADAVHAALGGRPPVPLRCEWCGYEAADQRAAQGHAALCLYAADKVRHRDLKPDNVLSIAGVADF